VFFFVCGTEVGKQCIFWVICLACLAQDNVTACNQIHCTGAPETHLIKSPAIKNSKVGQNSEWKQERNINSDLDQCLLCKAMSTAVNMVYYYLNGSEKSFPPEVEYFCIALEEPYIVQCGNMALAYSKEMWHFIRNQGLDSIDVCGKLKFCNSTVSTTSQVVWKQPLVLESRLNWLKWMMTNCTLNFFKEFFLFFPLSQDHLYILYIV
jgi:hypothetical protein